MNAGLLVTLLVGGLGIGGAVGYLAGSEKGRDQAVQGIQACPEGGSDSQLFMIDGKTYKTTDLGSEFQSRLYTVDKENYGKKEALIREQAMRVALSKDRSDLSKLAPLEELLPKPQVSDDDVKKFFDENKQRLPPNATLEQFKDRIAGFLAQQKQGEGFQKQWAELEKSGKVKLLVREPLAPLVSVPVEKFPSMGSKSAPNVLVEISDYLCPHCQHAYKPVKEAVKELGGQLRLVQINFALRPDKLSGSLVGGAFCASEQGEEQFWKYHDVAFGERWGTMNDAADANKAVEIAKKSGIDAEAMKSCMASQKPKKFIDETNKIINSLGVTGTPAFFLNNRRVDLPHHGNIAAILKSKIKAAATN